MTSSSPLYEISLVTDSTNLGVISGEAADWLAVRTVKTVKTVNSDYNGAELFEIICRILNAWFLTLCRQSSYQNSF